MSTDQKVLDLIAEQFFVDVGTLSLDTNLLNTLDADSLDIVELQMKCDEKFAISIPDSALDGINTVRDVIVAVDTQLEKKKEPVRGEQLDD